MKKSLKETINSLIEEREIRQHPPCPDCGSETGLGTSGRGQQEYRCKNKHCLRSFSESTKTQPRRTNLNNPPCPDCGSLKVHKKGIDASSGAEKYTCYECLRSFRNTTQESENRQVDRRTPSQQEKEKSQRPPCPECSGNKIIKLGYARRGTGEQLYRCKDCFRTFQRSTKDKSIRSLQKNKRIIESRAKNISPLSYSKYPPCPDCASKQIRRKGFYRGEQKYYCNNCSRIFTESTKDKPRPVHPPCPECSSSDVHAHGKRGGQQYYRCKTCLNFFKEHRNDPPCPDCGSFQINKSSTRRNQQQYRCKECGRHFSESTKHKAKDSPHLYDFESDIWDLRELGIYFPPSSAWFTGNFTHILQPWLKVTAKHFIKHSAATLSGGGCLGRLQSIKAFSRFIAATCPELQPSEIDRGLIINFLVYLRRKYPSNNSITTRNTIISHVNKLIELSHRFGWLSIPNPNVIYKEDYPKEARTGKTFDQIIPDEVLEQILANLDGLIVPYARMVMVMLETGMRVSEVCGLRYDCLRQDAEGDYWLHFWDYKLNKEHDPVPVTKELAVMLQSQQKFIRENLGDKYNYMFCGRKGGIHSNGSFKPTDRPPFASTFRDNLERLATEKNITYQGEIWHLSKTHRFRHTKATELINKKVPITVIQHILGHASPEMTMHYAKLYDETVKEAWKQTLPKMVDITGAVYNTERTKLDEPKYKELKKQLIEQRVHNGFCNLPAIQTCPKLHACYTCTRFRTTAEELPNLKADKAQLEVEIQQFEEEAAKCQDAGKIRLAEGNQMRAKQAKEKLEAINKMIHTLEVENNNKEA